MKKIIIFLLCAYVFAQVGGYPGINVLDDLDDTDVRQAKTGQGLIWDGTIWTIDSFIVADSLNSYSDTTVTNALRDSLSAYTLTTDLDYTDSIDVASWNFYNTGILTIDSIIANYGDSILTIDGSGNIGYTLADSLGGGGGTTLLGYSENGTFSNGQTANAPDCIVLGDNNSITNAFADYSVISGGYYNEISGYDDADNADYSTIGGGFYNRIINDANNNACYYSTIAGGQSNLIKRKSDHCTIGGGRNNTINADGYHTICGGKDNTISGSYTFSTIAGGYDNTINSYKSIIGAGEQNTITGDYSAILGGSQNSCSGGWNFVFGNNVDITGAYTTAFYDSVNPGHFSINCDDSDTLDADIALQVNGGVFLEDSLKIGTNGDFINGFYFAGDSLFIINGSDTMKFVED
jgi:hypothetical protein